MKLTRIFIAALALVTSAAWAQAAAQTQLTWYGHAAFKLTTPSGKVVLLDPWIKNPANAKGEADLAALAAPGKVDLILITHGHMDHIGDALAIAQASGAQLVATFDLGKSIVNYQGFPEAQFPFSNTGNFGGEISVLGDEVKVAFIPAVHSSSVTYSKDIAPGGHPGGFLVSVKNGPSVYHTGDTDVFTDMALIKNFRRVDVMLTTIGDKFTMGPARAAVAASLVQPAKWVIPMHFGTFPVLTGTPAQLKAELKARKVKAPMREMSVGQTIAL
jgi:L-ascorbate metabolism protein UlaG (beta-lactamase superfamily)